MEPDFNSRSLSTLLEILNLIISSLNFNNVGKFYLNPKTLTGLSPKRSVFSSFNLTSLCFQWPCTLSYLNIYVCIFFTSNKSINKHVIQKSYLRLTPRLLPHVRLLSYYQSLQNCVDKILCLTNL